MSSAIRHLVTLPDFQDEDLNRRARLLQTVLAIFGLIAVLMALALLIVDGLPTSLTGVVTFAFIFIVILLNVWLYFMLRRGRVSLAGVLFVSALWAMVTGYLLFISGLLSDAIPFVYPLIIVLAGLLISGNAAVVFVVLSVISISMAMLVDDLGLMNYPPNIASWPLVVILSCMFLAFGFLVRSAMSSLNAAIIRAQENERAQTRANRQLEAIRASLEDRVAERTATLERRARQLQVAFEVGRVATSIRDVEELLSTVAALVAERLGFYHVGIFLVDEPSGEQGRRYAVLRASNSDGGKLMLARQHRLPVEPFKSIVGHVADTLRPRVAHDIESDEVHLKNPLLPYTRSEVALPLVSGERLIGVLDVQSSERNVFSEDDVSVLRVLADQLSIAIENAELFVQGQEALEAQRQAYGEVSRQGWREAIGAGGDIGYLCNAYGVQPVQEDWQSAMIRAYAQRQMVYAEGTTLAIPIDIRDNVEGVVRLCKDETMGDWTEDEAELMRSLVAQLGIALDSARLYQETQLRAAYQQQLGEVTSRIRQTLDIETVLRTAAEQVREALGLPEVVVQLTPQPGKSRDEAVE